MELDLQKINDILTYEEDNIRKTLLYRLTFKLINKEYKEDIFSKDLLKYQIYKMRTKYFSVVKESFFDEDIKDEINNHYLLLKELKEKIDVNNIDQIFKIKYEVTILECLLDLDISYIDTANIVLNELVDNKILVRE